MSAVSPQRIAELLAGRFANSSVLTWQDWDGEHAESFDEIAAILGEQFPGLVTFRVAGNEFGVRNAVYAALDAGDPDSVRVLIYRGGPAPEQFRDNWLLDIEIGYGVFTANTSAMLMHDLGLDGYDLAGVLDKHPNVLRTPKQVAAARAHLSQLPEMASEKMSQHLRGVLSATALGLRGTGSHRLHRIVERLFEDLIEDRADAYDTLVEHGLGEFLWQGCARIYGYQDEHDVGVLASWFFERAWTGWHGANNAARLDFERWRTDLGWRPVFTRLAEQEQKQLNIKDRVRSENPSMERLAEMDIFPVVDAELLATLTDGLLRKTVTADQIAALVRTRSITPWFGKHEHAYRAIESAAGCLARVDVFSPKIADVADGVRRYAEEWSEIDRAYRAFRYHCDKAQGNVHPEVADRVEHRYLEEYQRPLAAAWQERVDAMEAWRVPGVTPLSDFAAKDLPAKKAKTLIVISDALRYEVGRELADRVNTEHEWFNATVEPRLAPLPSFTQLGMAAHLPHQELDLIDDETVRADGRTTGGLDNRAKIWKQAGVKAIGFEEANQSSPEELALLWSEYAALVVYHDRIDRIGDNAKSEQDTPEACRQAIDEIIALVTKFGRAKMRTSRVLITADHGFLYQSSHLQDSDFLSERAHGDTVVKTKRRFVLGQGLRADPAFTLWEPEQLGLIGSVQVQIPNSLYRMRIQGRGVRFVHGGATLQEVVVPLVELRQTKQRKQIRKVEVEISTTSRTVTSSTVVVTLTQAEAVSATVRARRLRVGVWANGELLSNTRDIDMDSTTDDIRERVVRLELVLSDDAQKYNGKEVKIRADDLRGESRIDYKDTHVVLQRGFGGFFDQL
ncbi:BREX-1 system phosphatase PglZ type A [Nocardia sp. NPDC006630]|uniref:BREX-1 system phosphatase PglZ type A n=1 Tax=Nocardia sp. NPDC006630 TaxID=3157181 RepID=UPI0033AD53DD